MRIKLFLYVSPLFALFVICSLLCLGQTAGAMPAGNPFDRLEKRLVADGFHPDQLAPLYRSGAVTFDVKGVSLFFQHHEGSLNYDQFLSKPNIKKANAYLRNHQAVFQKTEQKFGVEPQVIAGIILVETRLGRFVGNRSVLDTLSTMSALDNPPVRRFFWEKISEGKKKSRKRFEKKANRKSRWAYRELKAFLTHAFREKVDPRQIKGSYAGAMGICQFMPSNVLAYAQDGNEDGRIDLFDHADAIASIGAYLKHFGWRPGIEHKKKYKAVWYYNRSSYYVNTVLKAAELMKGL